MKEGLDASSGASSVDAFVHRLRVLADAGLRVGVVVEIVHQGSTAKVASLFEAVCANAERGDVRCREALVTVVDAVAALSKSDALQRLREEAAGAGLAALDRLLRRTAREAVAPVADVAPKADGKSRPLTLGERKSLARKTDRALLLRLLADPHPAVVARVLANPRLGEDDVLALATRRPGNALALAEVSRALRWVHRPRVRRALVLNPSTPEAVAMPLLGLLLRNDLVAVATAPDLAPALRDAARERLERMPPVAVEL